MINKITHEGTHDNGVPFTFVAERMASNENESYWSFYCTEGTNTAPAINVCSMTFPIGHVPTLEDMSKALIKGIDKKREEQSEEDFLDEDHKIWLETKNFHTKKA